MASSRSLRVILATVGSRGDVQPIQARAARGHHAVIAAPPNFATWVRDLGFDFAPVGIDIQVFLAEHNEALTANPVKMIRETSNYFTEQIPVQAKQLMPICEDADAMLWGGLTVVAPTIADHLRLPIIGVLYTSCMLPSSQHPPISIPWHGLPNWMNDLLWRANRFLGDTLGLDTINAVRAGLEQPPIEYLRQYLFDDHPLVATADEVVFPADPLWEGRYPYANFISFDDPAPLDPELDVWLSDGKPPVFVGFGSMSGASANRVEGMIIETVSASGRRCIVGAGWAGLGAGVPQVLLPLILDQFHHAHRLHLTGIAPRLVPMEKINAAELAAVIQRALQLPADPRQTAAARLRARGGRGDIVRRLEAMVAA